MTIIPQESSLIHISFLFLPLKTTHSCRFPVSRKIWIWWRKPLQKRHETLLSFVLIFSLISFVTSEEFQDFTNKTIFRRRILHQPLFPATPTPPSEPEPPPPLPPPPLPAKSDNPFFHENANGETPDQPLTPLRPPQAAVVPGVAANNVAVTHLIAPQIASKPMKKVGGDFRRNCDSGNVVGVSFFY